MTRLVNQKPLNEVFQSLKGDIPEVVKEKKEVTQVYLDGKRLRSFFEEIIPPKNYDFVVTDAALTSASLSEGKKSACFVCIGTLTILDDEGEKVVSKSCVGSYNLSMNEKGYIVDMSMAAKNAAGSALKECIRMFGCGERQLREAKENLKGSSRGGSQRTQNRQGTYGSSRNPATDARMPEVAQGCYQLCATGKAVDRGSMVLIPVCFTDRDHKGYKTNLLIWKSNHPDIDALQDRILNSNPFFCEGKFEQYNGNYRIVFQKFLESRAA